MVSTWLFITTLCAALALHTPSIFPEAVKPPVLNVSVTGCALPKMIFFAAAALVMVGWLVNDAVPNCTISKAVGGLEGEPVMMVQLAAVFQSLLVPPFHCTTLAASDKVHRLVISVNPLSST